MKRIKVVIVLVLLIILSGCTSSTSQTAEHTIVDESTNIIVERASVTIYFGFDRYDVFQEYSTNNVVAAIYRTYLYSVEILYNEIIVTEQCVNSKNNELIYTKIVAVHRGLYSVFDETTGIKYSN